MKCKEFKRKVNVDLNTKDEVTYTRDMLEHKSGCAECAEYFEAAIKFQHMYTDIPEIELPPELEHFDEIIIALEAAGIEPDDWKQDLAIAWMYLLVAAGIWGATLFLSPGLSLALDCLIVLGSVLYLALRDPKPKQN
jgi:hypothetical protein